MKGEFCVIILKVGRHLYVDLGRWIFCILCFEDCVFSFSIDQYLMKGWTHNICIANLACKHAPEKFFNLSVGHDVFFFVCVNVNF